MRVPSRRLRRAFLGSILVPLLLLLWARESGFEQLFAPVPFRGRLQLEHGVVVEEVALRDPPARLLVARVPRGQGLRLRALLLDDAQPRLRQLGEVAPGAGALVGINGDMHRLSGFCAGTPFSGLVDQGRARVLGSPFSYACAFWLDRDGQPHVGPLELGLELTLPDGTKQPAFAELEDGGATPVLVTRVAGAWSADLAGLALEPLGGSWEEGARWRVGARGEPGAARTGPALLFRAGIGLEALERLRPGQELTARVAGAAAGKVETALGTGPRLLEGGEVAAALGEPADAGWTTRVGRTAIGVAPRELILAVTFQAPRQGLTLLNLARALRALGCTEAVNLDGGPSSSLWVGGAQRRVLNTPPGADDPVASGLLVLPPAAGAPGLR